MLITSPSALPHRFMDAIKRGVVRPERFELPTLWFEAKCSIQLSYGRTLRNASSVNQSYRLAYLSHRSPNWGRWRRIIHIGNHRNCLHDVESGTTQQLMD